MIVGRRKQKDRNSDNMGSITAYGVSVREYGQPRNRNLLQSHSALLVRSTALHAAPSQPTCSLMYGQAQVSSPNFPTQIPKVENNQINQNYPFFYF